MILDIMEMFIGGFVIVAIVFSVDSFFIKAKAANNGK